MKSPCTVPSLQYLKLHLRDALATIPIELHSVEDAVMPWFIRT